MRNSQSTEIKLGLKRFEKHYLQQMTNNGKAAKSHLSSNFRVFREEVLVFQLLMTTASLELGLVLKGHQTEVEWQEEREREGKGRRGRGRGRGRGGVSNLSCCGFM